MSVITEEEKGLLQKAASFDESALAEIYDRYQDPLYRYALRLLGNEQLAEDCLSDTFLRFLKALRQGNLPCENLRAYLYRIAHNWIADHYRMSIVTENIEDLKDPDGQPKIEEQIITNLQRKRLRQALISLTPEQQQVIILKYFEGWQNEDIAHMIGKRVGAVKALAHRSIRMLRKKYQDEEQENVQKNK